MHEAWLISAACALGAGCAALAVQPEGAGRVMERFDRADADGDGVLTREEFPFPRLFASVDADGDGRITREEAESIGRGAATDGNEVFTVRRNIEYVRREGSRAGLTSLDVYAPREPGEEDGRPIVVYVHGGGWRIGDKARVQAKPEHFCASGFVFVSVNYRLSPAVTHPAHAEDVGAALAWVHDHAAEFGGDPDRVILTGHSAGAHLVALVATDPTYLERHGLSPAWLRGVVPLDSASYDIEARADDLGLRGMIRDAFGEDPAVQRDASPLRHVREGDRYPPMCVVYAGQRRDAKRESERFVDALRAVGADAEIVRAEGKDHAGVNADVGEDGDAMSEAIDAFIARVLGAATEPADRPE